MKTEDRNARFEDVTVIAPTLNERDGVEELSTFIHQKYPGMSLVVADDGSTDGTQEMIARCRAQGHLVELFDRSQKKVHGLTASVIDALLQTKTKYIVVMDADLQHPPEAIAKIISQIQAGADLVIGTRGFMAEKWNLNRLLVSRVATRIARIRLFFSGVSVFDPMSGFFGIRTSFAQQMYCDNTKRFELRGYKVLFDYLKIIPDGTKLSAVVYNFDFRKKGCSKMNARIAWLFFASMFK